MRISSSGHVPTEGDEARRVRRREGLDDRHGLARRRLGARGAGEGRCVGGLGRRPGALWARRGRGHLRRHERRVGRRQVRRRTPPPIHSMSRTVVKGVNGRRHRDVPRRQPGSSIIWNRGKEKLRGCEFFSRPMVPRRCPFQLKKSPVVAPSTRLATRTDLVLDLQVQHTRSKFSGNNFTYRNDVHRCSSPSD